MQSDKARTLHVCNVFYTKGLYIDHSYTFGQLAINCIPCRSTSYIICKYTSVKVMCYMQRLIITQHTCNTRSVHLCNSMSYKSVKKAEKNTRNISLGGVGGS